MKAISSAIILASYCGYVAPHGFVPQVKIGNVIHPGWNVNSDWYQTPMPARIVRPTPKDSGFVQYPETADITCSLGNYLPTSPITATVAAGSDVTLIWNTWPIGHWGPIMDYMAKCPSTGCSTWKGDTGTPWFKIAQQSFSNGTWPTDTLAKNDYTHTVTIPSKLSPGEYLLRHELLALHGGSSLYGAQFYPVCVQLTVTGSGTLTPSGLGFPGAYKSTDPGILFNVYLGDAANEKYVPPGGAVYKF